MFQAIFSLVIRSILTVITTSGFIHVCRRLHGFVYHDIIFTKMTNKMQLCRIIYCSLTALHVSSDIFANHQEHLTVITDSGFIHVCRRLHGSVHHDIIFTKMTNKMQLCRIIYCSLTALHVSSDIFAHHQEHLSCNYSFWFYSRVSLWAAADNDARE